MLYGRLLSRPAAAEVRQMLHRIRAENIEKGKRSTTAYMETVRREREEQQQGRQQEEDLVKTGKFSWAALKTYSWAKPPASAGPLPDAAVSDVDG